MVLVCTTLFLIWLIVKVLFLIRATASHRRRWKEDVVLIINLEVRRTLGLHLNWLDFMLIVHDLLNLTSFCRWVSNVAWCGCRGRLGGKLILLFEQASFRIDVGLGDLQVNWWYGLTFLGISVYRFHRWHCFNLWRLGKLQFDSLAVLFCFHFEPTFF